MIGNNFIFVHIYKTAGKSVTSAIQSQETKKDYLFRQLTRVTHRFSKNTIYPPMHAPALVYKRYCGEEQFNRMFKFCFVRNPFDWQVSLYHYAQQATFHPQKWMTRKMTFTEYIDWRVHNALKLQKTFIVDENNSMLVDFVGRLETIDVDLKFILGTIGIPTSTETPWVNKSTHRDFRSYYDSDTERMVAEAFKDDFEFFGYSTQL
jgi:hypothetical protein